MTERKYALFASTSLLVMAFIAFFSYGFVHGNLVIQGDASTTFHNIQTSNSLFKAEVFGWIIIFITDIVAAWALYFFLKPIHTSLSLLAALLRLMYTAVLGIAIFNLILALLLSKNNNCKSRNIYNVVSQCIRIHLVCRIDHFWIASFRFRLCSFSL